MAADARNTVHLVGGLTDTPEIVGKEDNVLRGRLAVDYAGSDATNKDNRSGYFTVKMFYNENSQNAKFVFDQVKKGSLKKGSQVVIVGRLDHSRWATDEGNRSEVQVIIESLSYVGSRPDGEGGTGATTATATTENVPNW